MNISPQEISPEAKALNDRVAQLHDRLLVRDPDGHNQVGCQIQKILYLADKLPTGLPDWDAVRKIEQEREEYLFTIDCDDRLTESVDMAYYAIKALHLFASEAGLSIPQLLAGVIAKYELRAAPGNPKNHEEERKAVLRVVRK
jgi:hypothetical protein